MLFKLINIMEETICIFGASTTWGAWDKEKGGWVNRLRLFLEQNDDTVFVYNLGILGDTSKGLLKRIKIESEARNPTLIIISIGENDSAKNSYVYVPIKEFKNNILETIKIAKTFTDKILLLGTKNVDESKTCPVPWDKTISYTNKDFEEYDKAIKKIAEKESVNYLKMSDLLDIDDLEDGIHPNLNGHQKIFLRVKEFIIKNRLV